jgi:hypothetical protein
MLLLNSIPPPHLVPCLFVRWHRCSFCGAVLEFCVVLPSHIRQWVLHYVAKPYHTVLCCVAQATSHSFVLCCQASSDSEFYVVLPSRVRQRFLCCVAKPHQEACFVLCWQATSSREFCVTKPHQTEFCVVLPSHIRQWVLLHKFELLECSGGHQNSDLCYEGKIILCWSIYSSDHQLIYENNDLCSLWAPVSV